MNSPDYIHNLKQNIWKLHALFAVRGSLVHISVLVLFLMEQGLSIQDVFILQASWSVLQLVLEIPSGYISDTWGRRNTLLLASLCKVIGILCYALSHTFPGFLLGCLTLGLGSTLYSGTKEAMTYDTLLELGQEKKYREISSKQGFYQFGAEAIASILAVAITLISLRATLWTTLLFFCAGPIIAFTLEEPRRKKKESDQHFQEMIQIFKKYIIHHAPIRSIVIVHSVIATMVFTLHWLTQPYQEMIGIPLYLFGLIHSVYLVGHALAIRFAHKSVHYIDDRLFLILIGIGTVSIFILLGSFVGLWAVGLFFAARVMWGFIRPVTSDLVNRMTPSNVRATVLSFNTFGFRAIFTLISPIIGYSADVLSIEQAIGFTGIIGGVVLLITFVSMRNVWKEIPS